MNTRKAGPGCIEGEGNLKHTSDQRKLVHTGYLSTEQAHLSTTSSTRAADGLSLLVRAQALHRSRRPRTLPRCEAHRTLRWETNMVTECLHTVQTAVQAEGRVLKTR